jgi:hypothetical protein
MFYTISDKPYPINKWIKDKKIGKVHFNRYPKGFHFYKTRQEARERENSSNDYNYVIRKVLVKNIVASGSQGCYKGGYIVGVARQMKIIN